jgi:hypothetical protein
MENCSGPDLLDASFHYLPRPCSHFRESSWLFKSTRDFLFTPQWRSEVARLLLYWPQWGVRVALHFSFFAECGSLGGRFNQKIANFTTLS